VALVIGASFVIRISAFVITQRQATVMRFTELAIQIIADDMIRAAIARGEFDQLPGLGQPLDFEDADDPNWWLRRKLREEGLRPESILPVG
jgi:hypothetical protein